MPKNIIWCTKNCINIYVKPNVSFPKSANSWYTNTRSIIGGTSCHLDSIYLYRTPRHPVTGEREPLVYICPYGVQ